MGEKKNSLLGRIREAVGGPPVSVEAPPESEKAAGTRREPSGKEEIAAAVALAIDRGRRAFRSAAPAFKITESAGPDEWAMSGRLAQVDRAPARDPWNR